jgi:hypothetical protein
LHIAIAALFAVAAGGLALDHKIRAEEDLDKVKPFRIPPR